jgi:hypothetical protein
MGDAWNRPRAIERDDARQRGRNEHERKRTHAKPDSVVMTYSGFQKPA